MVGILPNNHASYFAERRVGPVVDRLRCDYVSAQVTTNFIEARRTWRIDLAFGIAVVRCDALFAEEAF